MFQRDNFILFLQLIESCHIRLTNVIIATGIVGIAVLLVVVVALVKCRKIRRAKKVALYPVSSITKQVWILVMHLNLCSSCLCS